jgi:hypothetical protein
VASKTNPSPQDRGSIFRSSDVSKHILKKSFVSPPRHYGVIHKASRPAEVMLAVEHEPFVGSLRRGIAGSVDVASGGESPNVPVIPRQVVQRESDCNDDLGNQALKKNGDCPILNERRTISRWGPVNPERGSHPDRSFQGHITKPSRRMASTVDYAVFKPLPLVTGGATFQTGKK